MIVGVIRFSNRVCAFRLFHVSHHFWEIYCHSQIRLVCSPSGSFGRGLNALGKVSPNDALAGDLERSVNEDALVVLCRRVRPWRNIKERMQPLDNTNVRSIT